MHKIRNYSCLKNTTISLGAYSIVSIREQDIMLIKDWRNSQLDVLRQKKIISTSDQQNYFEQKIWPTFSEPQPSQILLSFLLNKQLIGYGGLVHISWEDKRGELSFLTDPSRHDPELYEQDFTTFIQLMKILVFQDLGFNRIHGETYSFRTHHVNILEKNGFLLEGILKNHIWFNGVFIDSLAHGCNKPAEDQNLLAVDTLSNTRNILVTSISRKVPLLNSLKTASRKINSQIKIIGADSNMQCIGKHFCDSFWEMPPLNSLRPTDIIEYCKENQINALIPSRDQELLFFALNKTLFNESGICVMISENSVVNNCLDKLVFFQWLSSFGFPTIPTFSSTNLSSNHNWVVKERFGAGSTKMALNVSAREAAEYSLQLENPIFQPFIEGKEYSIDAYISTSGKVKGIICRSRDLVISGESQISTTLRHPEMEKLVEGILKKIQFYGHVIFQFLIDSENTIHIIECNPRFGGASTLSVECGLDSFYWFLLESIGQNIDNLPFNRSVKEKKQIRSLSDQIQPV
jgi:predicted ATP-grasp superfamily ATP-dependent carboligase/RimJ/RimL family protein N-acetyltransferase